MPLFYVYVYQDPSRNMEPFYIGKGKGNRASVHLSRKDKHPLVHRIKKMKALGIAPVINIIESIDENYAYGLEEFLIKTIGRKDTGIGPLLNLTNGGEGVKNLTPESKERMRNAKLGVKPTEEQKKKTSASLLEFYKSEAGKKTSKRLALQRTGQKRTIEARIKMSDWQQVPKSQETLAKLSAARKGKKQNPPMDAESVAKRAARTARRHARGEYHSA